jgi:hypothetical protein
MAEPEKAMAQSFERSAPSDWFPERDPNLQLYGYSSLESGWDLFQLSY